MEKWAYRQAALHRPQVTALIARLRAAGGLQRDEDTNDKNTLLSINPARLSEPSITDDGSHPFLRMSESLTSVVLRV